LKWFWQKCWRSSCICEVLSKKCFKDLSCKFQSHHVFISCSMQDFLSGATDEVVCSSTQIV
jgi:hypothetical protein